ncbi:hypothetical protein BSIN_1589 [Burkholderia singularis]|uniref:Uncharacterized protein n=1 Tax=Burkholderia singularis TaxID=1503053 RepID=A0A238GZA1_9BURK|nr:hypothetical protein BSIN_1589 [Burkholderia singularis]
MTACAPARSAMRGWTVAVGCGIAVRTSPLSAAGARGTSAKKTRPVIGAAYQKLR